MIVGFDHDDTRIFKAHHEFIRQTDIMHAMVGMLVGHPEDAAIRALEERRPPRSFDDEPDGMFGTNVIPLGMTRDELREGYIGLVRDLHDPEFYFDRLENLYLRRGFNFARTRNAYWRQHPWIKRKSAVGLCAWSDRLVSPADVEGSRPGAAPHLSPPDGDHAPPRPDPTVLFICVSQVRDALPPTHNVP